MVARTALRCANYLPPPRLEITPQAVQFGPCIHASFAAIREYHLKVGPALASQRPYGLEKRGHAFAIVQTDTDQRRRRFCADLRLSMFRREHGEQAKPACQFTQRRLFSSGSIAGRATGTPSRSARPRVSASSDALGGKVTRSTSESAMSSGMPPARLARHGILPARHSITVLGRLSSRDGMIAILPAPSERNRNAASCPRSVSARQGNVQSSARALM